MLKMISIIGGMFFATNITAGIEPLAAYQDVLIGLMIALLLMPWLTRQCN